MAKRKSKGLLKVYMNRYLVGELRSDSKRQLSFQYAKEWLERESNFPISRSLALQEEAYSGDTVTAYFDNLLPEGSAVRQKIAARMRASSENTFDILSVIGRDCVGALQFLPEDEEPGSLTVQSTPLTEAEIANTLRNLRFNPLADSEDLDFRISLAGVQEKTALLWHHKQWQRPQSNTPTSHIFKPQIGEIKPGLSFLDSVENEWLCSRIASAFGLPAAESKIESFEEVKVLVIRRFDRQWSGESLIRIPQEDLCQALGIPSLRKYQSDGGPGFVQIMDLLRESPELEENQDLFVKTQVLFVLLAAIDGHAKNFSLRWSPRGFWLTPLYDILSAQPVVDRGELQYEKLKMAMSVGDKPHWRVRDIVPRSFRLS